MSDTKTSDKFFEIDDPKFLITPDAGDVEKRLQKSLIDYKKVTDGYITFEGYVLGSNYPLMIGLHFLNDRMDFIEIFRQREYYQSESYNVDDSFEENSNLIRRRFGAPAKESSLDRFLTRSEEWELPNFSIYHSIYERFGRAERFSIRLE